jgi:type I restriction-modification system DNA methylase subunit
MTEGQGGGEFYTPTSIVRLLVEVLEPFNGKVLDPACGSGGMFVQSARFVAQHKKGTAPGALVDPRHREGRRHRAIVPDEPRGARAGR